MARFKVGIQLHPQHCEIDELRAAWERADELGVDSIFTWDHFFPLYGEPDGKHYECWSLLAAMAVTTRNARFGALVTCNSYRNPDLLADMARTVDRLSGGRAILGIGSGWFQRDYDEYGYEFGDAPWRLKQLAANLPRIEARLKKLNPPPEGPLPIMIGGSGEKVTLKLVAKHAQMWNGSRPPNLYAEKNKVLDGWCEKLGRDPKEIERTVSIQLSDVERGVDAYLDAGAEHLILMAGAPFDEPLKQLERLLEMSKTG
jgi:probable F420-dependent oxidoreductase